MFARPERHMMEAPLGVTLEGSDPDGHTLCFQWPADAEAPRSS